MKKKIIIILFIDAFLNCSNKIFCRIPSYSIKTTGKLYIVNKVVEILGFDLSTGKEVAEIPIDLESHEAVALSGQNKVVVTNYGTVDRDGNHIKVINTQTNKVEKL
jgi:DNA-binding beta-propeller fold protein YncE